jgi:tetratricopeptide (TPR) repeat protein
MARIRDLTDEVGRDHDILTTTEREGMLGGQYLREDPLVSYLTDSEQPQYVLRNKSAGVEIDRGDDTERLAPAGDYQALAVVTDVRVLFVVGTADGDHSRAFDLASVVESRAESDGLLSSALVVETVEGDRWRFRCRGDLSAVAASVDDAGQTWANARRLLEDAAAAIDTGRDRLGDGAFDAAAAAIDDVDGRLRTARERVAGLGPGAAAAIDERAAPIRSELADLRREIAAATGGHHHAEAQRAWAAHEFEQAADHYETAAAAYRRAIETDATEPAAEPLRRRLRGLAGEREILRVAPMATARTARDRAQATDDLEEAAANWETALRCYREAVSLDWGGSDRAFVIDRDRAREQAVAACEEAIDTRLAASREWQTAGDGIAGEGRRTQARQAYQRAHEHAQRAGEIARELEPDRIEAVEDRLATVEDRLSGETVPTSGPEESVLPVEAVRDVLDGAATPEDAQAGDESGTTPPLAEASTADVDGETDATLTAPDAEEDTQATLRALDEGAFTALVAECWERAGWSTTVFSTAATAVYDVVAIRDDERLLIWTVHEPEGGTVDATAVRRCATARDSSRGADRATVVTTGRPTTAARRLAADRDVRIVDGEELADRIADAGLDEGLI